MAAYGVRKPSLNSIQQPNGHMPEIDAKMSSLDDSFSKVEVSPPRADYKVMSSTTAGPFRPKQQAKGRDLSNTQDEWAAMLGSQEKQAQRVDELVRKVKRDVMKNEYGKPQYVQGIAQREGQRELERYHEMAQKKMFDAQN